MSEQSRATSLEELAALNDELGALAQAGLPLEAGLAALGQDTSGRLGGLLRRLADRMALGNSLADAVAAERGALPAVYVAAIQAGLRAGRLPAVLEQLADTARNLADLRRVIVRAFIYPVIVLFAAWGLFVAFVALLVPMWQQTLVSLRVEPPWVIATFGELRGTIGYWGPAVPLAVLLLGVGFSVSQRAPSLYPVWADRLFGWIPSVRQVFNGSRFVSLADVLAVLVEHDVPLPEALELAGQASGDARLSQAAEELAGRLRRGLPVDEPGGAQGLPAFVCWSLANARRQPLAAVLRDYAEYYRTRTLQQAAMLRIALPAALLVLIGGSATLLYALTLFLPLAQLWQDLPNV